MGFRDAKVPNEGLKSQIKFDAEKTYHLKIMNDTFEQWSECWPVFPTAEGTARRRFVGNSDCSNLAAIIDFKANNGVPVGLEEQDQKNWKIKTNQATIVAVGTETSIVVTADMVKRQPALKKFLGQKQRKIQWDKENPKIMIFGVEILRQLKSINQDPDNIDQLVAKDVDTNVHLPTDAFAIKLVKTKKGGGNQMVSYTVTVGKFVGIWDDAENPAYQATLEELKGHMAPTDAQDVEAFISENSGGSSTGGEAPAVEDDDIPADDVPAEEIDIPAEEVEEPPKKALAKKAAPAPVKGKVAAPAKKAAPVVEEPAEEPAAEDELNMDDLDSLLE